MNEPVGRCPYCNDKDPYMYSEGNVLDSPRYYVVCPGCGMQGPVEELEPNAAIAWNYLKQATDEWKKFASTPRWKL